MSKFGVNMLILNYKIIARIAESRQTVIYKVYDQKNPERLLTLKIFKTPFLSDYKISQFIQRVEHLRILNDPQIIVPILFNVKEGVYFLTQDFFDGVPLNDLKMTHSQHSLNDFFTVACKLAQALDRIHEAGIIHGGLKPHNIIINPDTLDIRVIDFISSIDVREVSHFIYDRSFIKNTLA